MAEEIQKKKISELPSAVYLSDADVMPVVQGNGSSEATKKVDIGLVSSTIAESKSFSNLDTTSKTLVGAINEVNSSLGNVPSADEISYDNTSSGLSASDVQGAIDEIAQGGSGGSTVTVTQIQSTGTKIATITVDSVDTDLYAPNGGGGASAFEDLTDVDIDSATLSNGQVPIYNSISEKWENGTISSGSGHTIVDDAGTSLTQRTKLQFNGAYSEDNSTDDTTEINVVREMTKAEFDLLSADEKTGFINITDITGGNDDRFQPVIYSEEEREIGVWKDGKPLYQKTYEFSTAISVLANTYTTLISNSGLNIDTIVYGETSPSNNATFAPISLSVTQNDEIQGYYPTAWSIKYLTIRYTKTTDTAGSGQWTPQGVPAVHYSEDEQVVGTWIDGSTIYEKTIYVDSFPNNTSKNLSTPSNLDMLIDSFGFMKSTTLTGYFRTLPFAAGGSNDVRVDLNGGTLRVVTFSDWSGYNGYITIRYTKSST